MGKIPIFQSSQSSGLQQRSQDATDSEMRPALPLTLGRKDWLELFFERRGHGQAFEDHVVQGGPQESAFKVIRVFSASATKYGSMRVFRKATFVVASQSAGRWPHCLADQLLSDCLQGSWRALCLLK